MGQRTKLIKQLLDHSADVNQRSKFSNKTVLQLACRRGNINSVTHLLEYGAKIEEINEGFLEASLHGDLNLIKLLITHGVDINYKSTYHNNTALLNSIKNKHFKVAEYLISQGADVNVQDFNGQTALLILADMEPRPWYKFW